MLTTWNKPYLPDITPTIQKEKTMVSDPISGDPNVRASILVMDDEEHILTITQKMLEKFGYSVSLTEDGEKAIEMYSKALEKNSPFDLVIMDLTIPGGMGGKDASQAILKMDPAACIIISSGYSNDPVMSDYAAYGLKGIIPKPYRIAELKTTVEKILTGK